MLQFPTAVLAVTIPPATSHGTTMDASAHQGPFLNALTGIQDKLSHQLNVSLPTLYQPRLSLWRVSYTQNHPLCLLPSHWIWCRESIGSLEEKWVQGLAHSNRNCGKCKLSSLLCCCLSLMLDTHLGSGPQLAPHWDLQTLQQDPSKAASV